MRNILLLLASLVLASAAHAQSVAFTFDDGPDLAQGPLLTPPQDTDPWTAAMRNGEIESRTQVDSQAIIDAVRSRAPHIRTRPSHQMPS